MNFVYLCFLFVEVLIVLSDVYMMFGIDMNLIVCVLWIYVDVDGVGGYCFVGGGIWDVVMGYWIQGVYNVDDIVRVVVVFLWDWCVMGDGQSWDEVWDVLCVFVFLQIVSGLNIGRVVFWQQEDGILNFSVILVELLDFFDLVELYWFVCMVWVFGEGYVVFCCEDFDFVVFFLV